MQPLHARYPFLTVSREAVETADIDLATLVREERTTVVERALERIEGAIFDGRVPDPVGNARTELLSYPVARILISLVDEPVLTDRYALAEARRAFDAMIEDFSDRYLLRSGRSQRLTLSAVLEDFGLADALTLGEDTHRMQVTTYLSLTEDLNESRWQLSTRDLQDGVLTITHPELETLLREAVRRRVASGLPLDVPPAIAATLAADVEAIERSLADIRIPSSIDTVDPDHFPPCMTALIERWNDTADLSDIERFAVVSFLSTIGFDADDLVSFLDVNDPDTLRYQAEHVYGETGSTAYAPPSCAALQSVGGCVDDPDTCASIGHPVAAYATALERAEHISDWRRSSRADS